MGTAKKKKKKPTNPLGQVEKEEEMFFRRNHWDPVTAILRPGDLPPLHQESQPGASGHQLTQRWIKQSGSQVSPSLCCPRQCLPFFLCQHSQIIVKENPAGIFAVSSLKLGYTTIAWTPKEAEASIETRLAGEPKTQLNGCNRVRVKVKSLSRVRVFATPWTVAYHAPLSMGFSRQEYWSGLPFPSPEDLPNPGIEPGCPALQADALPSESPMGLANKGCMEIFIFKKQCKSPQCHYCEQVILLAVYFLLMKRLEAGICWAGSRWSPVRGVPPLPRAAPPGLQPSGSLQ